MTTLRRCLLLLLLLFYAMSAGNGRRTVRVVLARSVCR